MHAPVLLLSFIQLFLSLALGTILVLTEVLCNCLSDKSLAFLKRQQYFAKGMIFVKTINIWKEQLIEFCLVEYDGTYTSYIIPWGVLLFNENVMVRDDI